MTKVSANYEVTDEACAKRFIAVSVHMCVLRKKCHLRDSALSITFTVRMHTRARALTHTAQHLKVSLSRNPHCLL